MVADLVEGLVLEGLVLEGTTRALCPSLAVESCSRNPSLHH
ncbi:MAG: hypothetical protein RLZZ435_253 [Cyanobacteriota bacterium]